MPKWLGWLILVIIVVWVAHNPAQAGDDVKTWVSSFFTFVGHA
jgi:Flp pilus assembly pilin Flp